MIYLDNNSTTEIDPQVIEEVDFSLRYVWGNPSSIHKKGQMARERLQQASLKIATFFNAKPNELFFTSGGTEGLNMILRGIFADDKGGHLITSNLEHEAVYQTAKELEQKGVEVSYLSPLPEEGAILPTQVEKAIRPNTRLVSLMWANNETGAITEIEAIAKICHTKNLPFLVDAVAFVGKERISIPEGVSALCLSGHKIHAPKGVGVTFVRKKTSFHPLITGGAQQWGKRGGTENVVGIIGLAKALEVLTASEESFVKMRTLRDHFENQLLMLLPNVKINVSGKRVSNTSNISFLGMSGETLLIALDQEGVLASFGAACSSGALEASRILLNMGLSQEIARSSLRFSLSRMTTKQEIDTAISIIVRTANKLYHTPYTIYQKRPKFSYVE